MSFRDLIRLENQPRIRLFQEKPCQNQGMASRKAICLIHVYPYVEAGGGDGKIYQTIRRFS